MNISLQSSFIGRSRKWNWKLNEIIYFSWACDCDCMEAELIKTPLYIMSIKVPTSKPLSPSHLCIMSIKVPTSKPLSPPRVYIIMNRLPTSKLLSPSHLCIMSIKVPKSKPLCPLRVYIIMNRLPRSKLLSSPRLYNDNQVAHIKTPLPISCLYNDN